MQILLFHRKISWNWKYFSWSRNTHPRNFTRRFHFGSILLNIIWVNTTRARLMSRSHQVVGRAPFKAKQLKQIAGICLFKSQNAAEKQFERQISFIYPEQTSKTTEQRAATHKKCRASSRWMATGQGLMTWTPEEVNNPHSTKLPPTLPLLFIFILCDVAKSFLCQLRFGCWLLFSCHDTL